MSMSVAARIGGDVIVYEKGGYWNFVFITDAEHPLNFQVDGAQVAELRTPGRSRELRFDIPDGKREWGKGHEKIFNMGDDRLHGNNGTNSNLEVTFPPRSPADRETVLLLVPAGTVGSTDPYYSDYLYRPYPGGMESNIGHETAKYVTLTFDVDRPLELMDGRNLVYESPYNDGETLEIILDNDCLGNGHPDDFLMYYDWVRDSTDPRKFFTARKSGSAGGGVSLLSIQGNCDPTRIYPPPFP